MLKLLKISARLTFLSFRLTMLLLMAIVSLYYKTRRSS